MDRLKATDAPAPAPAGLTRRALLGGAALGAASLGSGQLPAWARPLTRVAGHRRPDSLPFPQLPAGTPTMPQIEHIVVLMMENHSFDNLLGTVPVQVPGRELVDGFTVRHGQPTNFNRDSAGRPVVARPASSPCQLAASRRRRGMPPNRRFLFTGTASGLTATNGQTFQTPAANGTIFDRLDDHHIEWRIYYQNAASALIVQGFYTPAREPGINPMAQFYADAAADRLPRHVPGSAIQHHLGGEPPGHPGRRGVHRPGRERADARAHWKHTALFLTYDEHGGYYDHVPPPRAMKPDSIAPIPVPGQPPLVPGSFDRYGFRVPLVVVSPWPRAEYVSHVVQDHTSITAFVERKWNLPAMTFRDANAQPMTDYFDFRQPAFQRPPRLAAAPGLAHGLSQCHAAGLQPPLPAA